RTTGQTPGVSAFVGPWRVFPWSIQLADGRSFTVPLAGRDGPGGAVDRLTLTAGRWTSGNSEVVLSQQFADNAGVRIGDRLTAGGGSPLPAMSVVGIATGVGREPDGWTAAAGVPLVTSGKFQTTYLMEYRLVHAG